MTVLQIELCKVNLEMIQELCDKHCEQEPSEILEHLNEIASTFGLCALTLSSLKYHYHYQMQLHLPKAIELKYPPSLVKEYCESCIPELMFLIKLAERLSSSLSHKNDSLRSMISYEKQERFMTNNIR